MVSKDGMRRLLATNATANATTPAAPVAPTTSGPAAYTTMLTDSTLSTKFTFQRAETKTTAFTFSLTFSGLSEGKKYAWGCVATSMNPNLMLAEFATAAVGGDSTTTTTPPAKPAGSSALWSSLIAAFIMIAAVFFY